MENNIIVSSDEGVFNDLINQPVAHEQNAAGPVLINQQSPMQQPPMQQQMHMDDRMFQEQMPPGSMPPSMQEFMPSFQEDPRISMMMQENSPETMKKKAALLQKAMEMEKKGVTFNVGLSMDTPLSVMEASIEAAIDSRSRKNGTVLAAKILTTSVATLEFLNQQYDPLGFDLTGWSADVNDRIEQHDFDDVLEELYEKYKGRGQMAPEVKLMFMLVGSAASCHLQKSILKSKVAGVRKIVEENPDILRRNNPAPPPHATMRGPPTNVDAVINRVMAANPQKSHVDPVSRTFMSQTGGGLGLGSRPISRPTPPNIPRSSSPPADSSDSSDIDSTDDDTSDSDSGTDAFVALAKLPVNNRFKKK